MLVDLSVMEQRYQAVSFVIHDGEFVVEVARRFNVSRQTVQAWLARNERGRLAALADRSHRPRECAQQMPAAVEAVMLELRRPIPSGGLGGGCTSWPGRGFTRCHRGRGSTDS